jgi:hypothetical protein
MVFANAHSNTEVNTNIKCIECTALIGSYIAFFQANGLFYIVTLNSAITEFTSVSRLYGFTDDSFEAYGANVFWSGGVSMIMIVG